MSEATLAIRPPTSQLLKQVPQSLRWLWEANARATLALCAVTLVMALLPAAMAWVGRSIIDGVVKAAKTGTEADRRLALQAMAMELALSLILLGSRRLQTYLRELIRATMGHLLSGRLLEKSLTLELSHFEDARTYDLLQNAQRDAPHRPYSLALATLMLARSLITVASLGALLWGLAWWSVVPLLLSAIPEFFIETKLSGEAFALSTGRAQDSRRLGYLESVLTRDTHVKEVKLYGLGPLFLERHRALFSRFLGEDRHLARRQLALGTFFAALSSLSFYVCYAAVGYRAALGQLSVGDLTLSISAFRQGQGALEDVLSSLAGLYDDALYVSNLSRFFELATRNEAPTVSPAKVLPQGRFAIELDHVSFRYPGREEWALRDLTLSIAPGEKLALVGENGVRYQLTAGENIGLGDLPRMEHAAVIDQAATDGGAHELLETLPDGRETMLGTWFEHGHELSGGQWQKLAVARSFMRLSSRDGEGADLLILDEPTAAIDAAAEAALFERFNTLTTGRGAIIISHRFSTVRMADRIAVLEHGQLLELGSHEALLAQHGRYAELFTLQARGYR